MTHGFYVNGIPTITSRQGRTHVPLSFYYFCTANDFEAWCPRAFGERERERDVLPMVVAQLVIPPAVTSRRSCIQIPHSTVASSKVVHTVVIEREFSFIYIINSAFKKSSFDIFLGMFYFATSDIMEAKLTVALRAIAAGAVAIFAKGAALIKATGGAKVGMATAAMTAATTAAVAGSKTEHK